MIVSKKSFDSAKLVHSATLSSNKIATANASHFVYTTLAEQTIARITKLLLIMDTIIIKNGIEFLRWTDSENNIWYAEADAVKFFGKEFFEEQPMDIILGSWQVVFASEDQADFDNLPDFIFA